MLFFLRHIHRFRSFSAAFTQSAKTSDELRLPASQIFMSPRCMTCTSSCMLSTLLIPAYTYSPKNSAETTAPMIFKTVLPDRLLFFSIRPYSSSGR